MKTMNDKTAFHCSDIGSIFAVDVKASKVGIFAWSDGNVESGIGKVSCTIDDENSVILDGWQYGKEAPGFR